ncbi:MAG: alpha-amylase, partial [Alphaproteobacteria bacterium]|nr:alpha-amylase [Alphaproteobacteria bacterium]
FYGGQRVELFGGATISGKFVGYENTLLAIEAGLPVYQNLNGPQIMKNWQAGMSLRFKI